MAKKNPIEKVPSGQNIGTSRKLQCFPQLRTRHEDDLGLDRRLSPVRIDFLRRVAMRRNSCLLLPDLVDLRLR